MPKHASRMNRAGANDRAAGHGGASHRRAGLLAAQRLGVLAVSGMWLAGLPAYAVTPLNTYFGPGLPLDNYFPQGVPGAAEEEGVTVRSRLRPEYNAQGIREGAFIIRPGFDEQAGYNSNVVGGATQGQGSSELNSSGSVSVNSDWSRNSIGFSAGVNDTRYFDVPRLSHTDYNASLGGSLDLGRDQLDLSVNYLSANEEPYDIGVNNGMNTIDLVKPLNFTVTDFRASYNTVFGRFTVTPNVDYQLFRFAHGDFSNVPLNSEAAFDQTLRDSNILQGGVIGRYEFQPNRDAVIVFNGNYNDYIHGGNRVDLGVVNSTGATVLAGLDYELTGAITLRALAGYQERFFRGRTSNMGAPIAEADVIWNPTGLTTVTARYARTIEDATTDTVTGYTYDRVSAIIDHELYRNILLQASAHLDKANYQGSNSQQTIYGGALGVTYLINRNIQTALSYQYIQHDDTGGSFGQSIILLNVKFGL